MPSPASTSTGLAPPAIVLVRWLDGESAAAAALAGLKGVLSASERRRASTMPAAAARGFAAGRVALRLLASTLSGENWRGRAFRVSATGKPEMPGSALQFSLSRSGSLVAAALSRQPVGIDIERRRTLAPEVRERIGRWAVAAALPPPVDGEAALRHWTRLEALTKRRGERLADRIAGAAWATDTAGTTRCFDLELPFGYVGTVAVAAGMHLDQGAADAAALLDAGEKPRTVAEWPQHGEIA
jgi:phosphopantetheinyl transferase